MKLRASLPRSAQCCQAADHNELIIVRNLCASTDEVFELAAFSWDEEPLANVAPELPTCPRIDLFSLARTCA
ncbi:MAG TPA: hypothetical protein VK540_22875 [Polyangiaceae bacterium]|nr:hypothetical protein [Polyangiaceae bacterium]